MRKLKDIATTSHAWISEEIFIEGKVPPIITPREMTETNESLKEKASHLSAEALDKKFPAMMSPKYIKAWRKATVIELSRMVGNEFDILISTRIDEVQHLGASEVHEILNDHYPILGKLRFNVLNKSDLLSTMRDDAKYFVFFDTGNAKEPQTGVQNVVIVKDVEGLYGVPAKISTYQSFLQQTHYEQDQILKDRWDVVASPAAEAVRDVRQSMGVSQELMAELAGISKATIVRGEKGQNISVETLMKLAKVAGKELVIKFD